MRLPRAVLGVPVVAALIALAGCGVPTSANDTTAAASSAASSADASAASSAPSSSSPPPTLGPSIPAETAVAAPVDRSLMPTASGKFGDKPTITVPSTPPPNTLQRVVLSDGGGTVTKSGDWLQVNYLGQVWGGEVFDNSYDRGSVFTFQLGGAQQMVVAGWEVGLLGVAQGSRVMLSFPPQDGYGEKGNPPKISGSDTLIFVVDIVKVIPAGTGGQADAEPQTPPAGLPTVEGALGSEPTITVPKSLAAPTETKTVVLAKGSGAAAQAGDVVVQYVATTWDGSQTEQSWPDPSGKNPNAGPGPASLPLQEGSPFASLIGVPLGSRVLLEMPADQSNGTPALAWVVDLLLQQDVAPATTSSGAAPSGGAPPSGSGEAPVAPTTS